MSSIRADHPNPRQSTREGPDSDRDSPALAGETLAGGDFSAPVRPAIAPATTHGPPDAGTQGDFSSLSGAHGPMGLTRERLNLTTAGLPQSVIATIHSARAPFKRSVYDGKCSGAFEDWCAEAGVLAYQSTVLGFLHC